jgi:hypothetical protein
LSRPSLDFTPPKQEDDVSVTEEGGEGAEAGAKTKKTRPGVKGGGGPPKKKAKKEKKKKKGKSKGKGKKKEEEDEEEEDEDEDEDKENWAPE